MVFSHTTSLPQSLYLHYPVCRHHCSYCDFNVYPAAKLASKSDFDRVWSAVSLRHAKAWTESFHEQPVLRSLYFGGGTPSFYAASEMSSFILDLKLFFDFKNLSEFTLEANPEDITEENLQFWADLGVNRLSLGVQSFESSELRRLERLTTASKVEAIIPKIEKYFKNYSLDLMFGIPDQNLESLSKNLNRIVDYRVPHVSIYLLTISPDHKWKLSSQMNPRLANEDLSSQMYHLICEKMQSENYRHYEVSNFAQPGFESEHNQNYWNPKSSYLGIGPGAHGYFFSYPAVRYENYKDFESWSKDQLGLAHQEHLTEEQLKIESIYLALRSGKPVPISEIDSSALSDFQKENLCRVEKDEIYATEAGWLVLDALVSRLLPTS